MKITTNGKRLGWLRIDAGGCTAAEAQDIVSTAHAAVLGCLGVRPRAVVVSVTAEAEPVIEIRIVDNRAHSMDRVGDAIAAEHRGRGRPVEVDERNQWTPGKRAAMRGKHAGRLRFNPASMRG